MIKYGPTIKKLRMSKMWAGKDFAFMIGITPTALTTIELGKGNPSHENLEKIAKALDMKVWEIVEIAEDGL